MLLKGALVLSFLGLWPSSGSGSPGLLVGLFFLKREALVRCVLSMLSVGCETVLLCMPARSYQSALVSCRSKGVLLSLLSFLAGPRRGDSVECSSLPPTLTVVRIGGETLVSRWPCLAEEEKVSLLLLVRRWALGKTYPGMIKGALFPFIFF